MENLSGLVWLIPLPPLLSFFIIILFLRPYRTASFLLSWLAIGTSTALSWTVAFSMFGVDREELAKYPVQIADSVVWMPFGEYTTRGCEACLRMGVAVDPLNTIMLFMVPFAVAMIYIYSVGYHNYGQPRGTHLGEPNHGKEDPMFTRFFALMSLFGGAMLILTVADNLLMLFVGWEIMGACSYMLIGFWYARKYDDDPKNPQKLPPRYASIKAFMVTRTADVVMLLGIVMFYRVFGTLNFSEAMSAESLIYAATHEIMGMDGGIALGIMAFLIFIGTVGKSAQWPLHIWLPNAMEGPTPVSAVIHAAAMVSAGIYLILRIFPIIAVGMQAYPTIGWTIAFIGAFTALMSATIAVAQDDVKGVLAYSTISQLGFMVAAVGIGAYIAAAFHLITHAYFKALLFLSSGSVIHGMEHGAEHVHDHHTDPQDMMNMGGLRKKMPITFWAFTIGGLALSGFPIVTAGFWSKDEIFADAWLFGSQGDAKAMFVFIMLCLAAFLTAFYTARQLCLTFLGEPRTPLAEHAHESNRYMTIPLIALAFFAITAGWVGIPDDFLNTSGVFKNQFKAFVAPTIKKPIEKLYDYKPEGYEEESSLSSALVALDGGTAPEITIGAAAGDEAKGLVAHKIEAPPFSWIPVSASVLVALGGLGLGYFVYGRKPLKAGEPDPLLRPLGPLHGFLMNKWYWDELWSFIFVKPVDWFSEKVVYPVIDKGIIDGIIHVVAGTMFAIGLAARETENAVFGRGVDRIKDGFLWLSREFRSIQTGKIQEYALISTFMAVALVIVIVAAYVYQVF